MMRSRLTLLLPVIFLAFTLTHCVSELDILGPSASAGGNGGKSGDSRGGGSSGGASNGGTSSGGASGGSSSGGQGAASGWSQASCYEALARGKTGDTCVGIFSCSTAARPPTTCCHTQASCGPTGMMTFTDVCDDCPCGSDVNCISGLWCTNGFCHPCDQPPAGSQCNRGLIPLPRNGCIWCVPASECGGGPGTAPCSPDKVCYAGNTCSPHCDNDPSCCFGNVCAAPGCGDTEMADCTTVGCPDGSTCFPATFTQKCDCTNGNWNCPSKRNTCVAQ